MTDRIIRILHLAGSATSDFYADLSRLYAKDCLDATHDPDRYEMRVAYVTPDGMWRFPEDLADEAIRAAEPRPLARAVEEISDLGIDVMVPQMFCLPGMTHYRAFFDLLGVPYIGNSPEVMALGANKARAKAVVGAAGVAVPEGETIRRGDAAPMTNPPVVIKPVDADNSLGVRLVGDRSEYAEAIEAALGHAEAALVEPYIELGREVRCGVIERDGELIGLPLEEYGVDREKKPVRDYADKISRDDDGELSLVAKEETRAWIVPAEDPATKIVWEAAKLCHLALGCRDYSLFDFRIDPQGRAWFLEAGLYCSFAKKSVVTMMAEANGMALEELFAEAVENALRRG